MKLRLVAVGRLKHGHAATGCAMYAERLGRLLPFEAVEVRDARRTKRGDPLRWKAEEADALRAALPGSGLVIALDERGRQFDSRGFARWLGKARDRGVPHASFLIGGPDGLDPALRASADLVWALGQLTMPHDLARLVLMEQLYRAANILSGTRYHRD